MCRGASVGLSWSTACFPCHAHQAGLCLLRNAHDGQLIDGEIDLSQNPNSAKLFSSGVTLFSFFCQKSSLRFQILDWVLTPWAAELYGGNGLLCLNPGPCKASLCLQKDTSAVLKAAWGIGHRKAGGELGRLEQVMESFVKSKHRCTFTQCETHYWLQVSLGKISACCSILHSSCLATAQHSDLLDLY